LFPSNKNRVDIVKGIYLMVSQGNNFIGGFDKVTNLFGGQREYYLEENLIPKYKLILEPYLTTEKQILEEFFKGEDFYLNGMKLTNNFKPGSNTSEIFGCSEQPPHIDVSTTKVIFLVIVISHYSVAPIIYGSQDEFNAIENVSDIKKFLQVDYENIETYKQGDVYLFNPSFIHAGPKIPDDQERILIYLEYVASSVVATKYETKFLSEIIEEEKPNLLHEHQAIGKQRKWGKIPPKSRQYKRSHEDDD